MSATTPVARRRYASRGAIVAILAAVAILILATGVGIFALGGDDNKPPATQEGVAQLTATSLGPQATQTKTVVVPQKSPATSTATPTRAAVVSTQTPTPSPAPSATPTGAAAEVPTCKKDVQPNTVARIEPECLVIGDVGASSNEGGPFERQYDDDGNTGLLLDCPEGCFVTSDWAFSIDSITRRDEAKAQLTADGCDADGCGSIVEISWPHHAAQTGSMVYVAGNADVRAEVGGWEKGSWHVTTYEGVTAQISSWFNPESSFNTPEPQNWPQFPDRDNPGKSFEARNGLHYGLDERAHCENDGCDLVVQAQGYNLVTGDYNLGFISCKAENRVGCAFIIFNVGTVSANFEDIHIDSGFSVAERYFNGEELDQAMQAVTSHVIANMLNFPTDGEGDNRLNESGFTNAGANCSVPEGCGGVYFNVVIVSGNQVLVIADTTFMKP